MINDKVCCFLELKLKRMSAQLAKTQANYDRGCNKKNPPSHLKQSGRLLQINQLKRNISFLNRKILLHFNRQEGNELIGKPAVIKIGFRMNSITVEAGKEVCVTGIQSNEFGYLLNFNVTGTGFTGSVAPRDFTFNKAQFRRHVHVLETAGPP